MYSPQSGVLFFFFFFFFFIRYTIIVGGGGRQGVLRNKYLFERKGDCTILWQQPLEA